MTNKEVIEQVRQGNWCAEFQPKQEANVNNDGNLIPKLTPQNAEQEHYIQILLAKMQGIPVEFWHGFYQRWEDSRGDSIGISVKHRIKQTPTPTPYLFPVKCGNFLIKIFDFALWINLG